MSPTPPTPRYLQHPLSAAASPRVAAATVSRGVPAVLQPAVEAFFLVHATERESKPPVRDTRESQLAHIKDEPPPLSPAPLTPATPSALDPFFSREPSAMHISASLPPDTQKFLRFAGARRGAGSGGGGGSWAGGLGWGEGVGGV